MILHRFLAILVLSVVAVYAGDAQAESPAEVGLPDALTLEQALEILRDQSPRSLADQARVAVAAADRIAARVYPNPSVSYGALALAQGVNTGAAWQHQIVLEQPLLFGQRRARSDLADLNVAAERARVAADLNERGLAVRQAFAALLADQERVRVLELSLVELSRLEQLVRGREQAGDRSAYDVARIELETTSVRVELRNAETDAADSSGRLASLLGFPGWSPSAEGSLDSRELPDDVEQLWAAAQRRHPAITAARAAESYTRGGLTLARRERLPVPALALGTQLTQDADSASVFLGFSIPIPVFDRGQGQIARANAEIRGGELAVEAELAQTRAEIERAHLVYARQRETLATVEQQMVANIPTFTTMAEEAYRGGSAGILELLDMFESVKNIRLTHLEQREAVMLAEAELITIAGLEPLGDAGR